MTDNQWDMLGVGMLLLMSVLVLLILFWLVRPAHSFCTSLAQMQGCTHATEIGGGAWVSVRNQCYWMDNIACEQFEPARLCRGVRSNPHGCIDGSGAQNLRRPILQKP